jgi:DnaJ-class molecular chaperone
MDKHRPTSSAAATGQAANPGDDAPPGTPGTGEDVCRACNGTGKVDGKACDACGGSGKTVEGVGGA